MAKYLHNEWDDYIINHRYVCVGFYSYRLKEEGMDVVVRDNDGSALIYLNGRRFSVPDSPRIEGTSISAENTEKLFVDGAKKTEYLKRCKDNPDHHRFILEYRQHDGTDEVYEIRVIPIAD